MNLHEFIARQLNDHEDCDHGVRQGTYHTWKYDHIDQALQLALSYLYSIKPDAFAEPMTYTTTEDSCVIDTSGVCPKPISILTIGDDCESVLEQTEETNSLMALMGQTCAGDDTPTTFAVTQKSGTVYLSSSLVPAGTKIKLLCARPPSLDTSPNILSEYQHLLVSFALWWILLTDNESRSNQPRWEAYYAEVQRFVETKLLLEFSLSEDDYKYGRRRVND